MNRSQRDTGRTPCLISEERDRACPLAVDGEAALHAKKAASDKSATRTRTSHGYAESVASEWTVRESTRVTPSSESVGASWSVRSSARDGRETSTVVEVDLAVMAKLAKGSVAKDTRLALATQGRGPVEVVVKRGEDPPARIFCSASGCEAR
jgi:hypothetical protein